MPAFSGKVIDKQILIHSFVRNLGTKNGEVYFGLVDTGAQKTLVSPKAVNEVGLIPSGTDWIIPANGVPVRCLKYRIRLDIFLLPDDTESPFWGREMDVVELPYQPPNYDALLGMDFLEGFRLTLYKSRFTLSIP